MDRALADLAKRWLTAWDGASWTGSIISGRRFCTIGDYGFGVGWSRVRSDGETHEALVTVTNPIGPAMRSLEGVTWSRESSTE